jgi:hypothetical protein
MLWALLAKFISKRQPWVQAVIFGLCVGLFVTAAAEANQRNPLISITVLLVLVVGAVAGGAFYLALRGQVRHGWTVGTIPPTWVSLAYAAAWLSSVLAALAALLGAGGIKVAVLAIIPIVLLAPPALVGIRTLAGRPPRRLTAVRPPEHDKPEPGLGNNRPRR